MNKNNDLLFKILVLVLIVGIIITLSLWRSNKNKYQVNDKLTNELYGYFKSDDLESCNGLFNYSDKKLDYNSVDNEMKLCLAYKNSDMKKAEEKTVNKDKKKLTCTVDKMVFRVNDDEKECSYTEISKSLVNDTYKKLYGKDIENDVSTFQLDNFHVCYVKDDLIYCGLSETYTYILSGDVNVYRTIEKTIEKSSEIEIYDYFLKITDDKCYNYYTTNDENVSCSKKLPKKKIKYNFLKKYGTLYKHVFSKNDDETYYWVSSEPVK